VRDQGLVWALGLRTWQDQHTFLGGNALRTLEIRGTKGTLVLRMLRRQSILSKPHTLSVEP